LSVLSSVLTNFFLARDIVNTMADDKPNCKVVLANNIAKTLLEEVHGGLKKIDRKPLLVGFLSSADPAARVYAEWTVKTCIEK
jgi:methylenetetrahydrofolate dehydrogenase (NAD+)